MCTFIISFVSFKLPKRFEVQNCARLAIIYWLSFYWKNDNNVLLHSLDFNSLTDFYHLQSALHNTQFRSFTPQTSSHHPPRLFHSFCCRRWIHPRLNLNSNSPSDHFTVQFHNLYQTFFPSLIALSLQIAHKPAPNCLSHHLHYRIINSINV